MFLIIDNWAANIGVSHCYVDNWAASIPDSHCTQLGWLS